MWIRKVKGILPEHDSPSPVKPGLHLQTKCPGVFSLILNLARIPLFFHRGINLITGIIYLKSWVRL